MSACSIGVNVRSGACTPDDPPSIDVTQASSGDLQSSTTGSVTLLVPDSAAADVVDASGANVAGLVLLQRGQPLDVDLEVAE